MLLCWIDRWTDDAISPIDRPIKHDNTPRASPIIAHYVIPAP